MPVVLGSLLGSIATIWFLNTKNELLFLCEEGLLHVQRTLVKAENQLLGLNPRIKTLVAQKKILQKALRVAKDPALFASLKAQLIQIEIQLLNLKQQQLVLMKTAQIKSNLDVTFLSQKLRLRISRLQAQWATRLHTTLQNPQPRIHLQAQHIDPSARLYVAPHDLAKRQTLTLHWTLKGSSLFPSWLTFLYDNHFYWQDSCSSRPAKKELEPWIAEIGMGRS